jgi:hypothetical protein
MFRHWRLVLFVGALVIVAIGFVSGQTGIASGTEWSPELFRHRSFRYFQYAGLQITPSETHEWESALDEYLRAEGFVPSCAPDKVTWEFVYGSAPGVRGWHGDAKWMCKGMGSLGVGETAKEWVEWSRLHPDLAKVLWPEIVRRGRKHQYLNVYVALVMYRDEMRSAKNADDIGDQLTKSDEFASQ